MKIIPFMIVLAGAYAIPAYGQGYGRFLEEVASNNLELSSSADMMTAELATLKSENNLPDPEVGFDYMWGRHDVGNKYALSVTQSFDWPGLYHARAKAAKTTSMAMASLARAKCMDKMMEVEQLFIDIINTRKNLALYSESMRLLDSLMAKYSKGAANGEFTRLDVNKIRLSQLSVCRRKADIQTQLDGLVADLQAANGGKPCGHIVDGLSDYEHRALRPQDEYLAQVERYDPQVVSSVLTRQSQEQMVKVAKMGNLPSFSIGYAYENEPDEIHNGISVSMTLPIFSNRNKVKAAKYAARAAEADIAAMMVDRNTAMRADYEKARVLKTELDEYDEIFGNSDYLTLLKKSLDGGQMSLLDYIQEMQYYLDEMSTMLSTEYELQQVMARLNRYSLLDHIPTPNL